MFCHANCQRLPSILYRYRGFLFLHYKTTSYLYVYTSIIPQLLAFFDYHGEIRSIYGEIHRFVFLI